MNKNEFFKYYLRALEEALSHDDINIGYYVKSYDEYIKDDKILNEMELFIKKNSEIYSDIFDVEDMYFDAKSHGFEIIDGISISHYKKKLLDKISHYKLKFCK